MKYLFLIILLIAVYSCEKITKEYYDNGNLKAEYVLNDSKQFHGLCRGYYENGNSRAIIDYENGRRIGTGIFYDTTGVLSTKEFYQNGLVKSYERYSEDGKTTYAFTYLDTLNLPTFDNIDINISQEQDTFTVGNTTIFDISCDLVSKNNLVIRMTNGIMRYDWNKENISYSFEPRKEGRTILTVWIKADDQTDRLYFIGKKEYPVKN